ncbi:MAG: STAS domain-containing protein [Rubrivivax sp.]|jgi:anti-anti-sigma regulatory factor|nr:STAS domain-containing protein [Rubrivivax sp.]
MTTAMALPAELTIYTAAQTRQCMLERLGADDGPGAAPFVVDGSAVAEIDGAGVQLLVALSRSLLAQGRRLAIAAPAETLASACVALGAASLVEAP